MITEFQNKTKYCLPETTKLKELLHLTINQIDAFIDYIHLNDISKKETYEKVNSLIKSSLGQEFHNDEKVGCFLKKYFESSNKDEVEFNFRIYYLARKDFFKNNI